ncbi:sensor histidine kinase [Ruminiclostridium josui]|uniref:sensor histidine kinase n=1 Tax=Ruminiclostridium josui TaxID=1499 RepID=UPI0006CFCEA8|nr:GHKL domain-containing protein [Ruminiclostridium josui]
MQPYILRKISIFIMISVVLFFLFEIEIKKLLYRVAILMGTSIISEFIVEMLIYQVLKERYDFTSNINLYCLYVNVVGRFIWFLAMQIVMCFYVRNRNLYSHCNINFLLFFPAILTINVLGVISLSSLLFATNINLRFVIVTGLLGLASCIVIFSIYDYFLKQNELIDDLYRKQVNIDYYNAQVQNQEILMSRYHEYKNSLITIKGLLGSNIDPDINAYLNELISGFNDEQELAITENFNNKVINSIFNYNRDRCKAHGIHLNIDIQHFDLGFLRPFDTGVLLNNLFNNAVEACNCMPSGSDKWIKLKICLLHDELIIAMRNSKCNTIVQNHRRIMSTKHSAILTGHGQGILNMKKCVARYNGSLNITNGDDYFEIFIRLKCTHV